MNRIERAVEKAIEKKGQELLTQAKESEEHHEDFDTSWTIYQFIVTSKGTYPASVLKSAEQKKEKMTKAEEEAQSKQLKTEQEFLDQNGLIPLPFEAANLLDLKDNCSYFDACVKQIAKDVMGQGYKLVPTEEGKESDTDRETIEHFMANSGGDRNETFEETLERGVIDWGCIGWWGWEVSRGDDDLVNGLWHVPAQQIRIHEDRDKFAQVEIQKKAWFKRFGVEGNIDAKTGEPLSEEELAEDADNPTKEIPEKANELIYYLNYYPQSRYYGAPNILSSVGSVFGLIGVRDYNLAFFENYGIPAALIVLEGRWTKDTAKQISDFIDVEIKRTENAHKTMIIHPSKDSKITVVKLSTEVKEGSFNIYQQSLIDEVLVAYKMPPYRIGIAKEGSLGGSTASESTKIYVDSVVRPIENVINNLVTKDLIREGLGIMTYSFKLLELDLRDLTEAIKRWQILFSIGAMNSNQIIKELGRSETYPEGNTYYVESKYIEAGEEEVADIKKFVEEMKKKVKK